MSEQSPSFVTSLTYKFLLLTTTSAAAFFCWLYITKPTTIVAPADTEQVSNTEQAIPGNPVEEDMTEPDAISSTASKAADITSFEAPSPDSFPGSSQAKDAASISPVNPASGSSFIPLANSSSTKGKPSWEETNDRVQHIITAQNGDNSERIILEVPVIYMTRGMRLGPKEAEEARRILRAIEIYQDRINKLQQDGENIAKAWNSLLMSTQPVEALRADSPSLPQKKETTPDTLKENSAATISIEE